VPRIVTYEPSKSSNLVLLQGTLLVRAGCIVVDAGNEPPTITLPLWPQGYSVRVADGVAQVLDASGETVGSVGQVVRLGGGPASRGDARRLTGGRVPDDCDGSHFFLVTSVVR